MKKIWLLAGLVLALLAYSAPYLSAQDKVLKIGFLGPFTGLQGGTGAEFKLSAEMALENIGYQIDDYKLEAVWIDVQCEPAQGVAAYSLAAEKQGLGVTALSWCSSVDVAVMDLAVAYKIPHLFSIGATELINEKYQADPEKYAYWSSKGWPMPIKLMRGYREAVETAIAQGEWRPETKTIAIYGEDSDWGRSAGGALKTVFSAAGWEVVSEDYFLNTQTDFNSLVNRYRASKVSLIAGTALYPALGLMVKEARESGLKSLIIADGLGWVGHWSEQIGEAGAGVLDMLPRITTPAGQAWAAQFEAKAGRQPSPAAAGLAYDGVGFLIKVLKRTLAKHGRLDSESIKEVVVSEVHTGLLAFTRADGAILMNSYRYTPETVPDPVVGVADYFFPVLQFDKDGAGHIIYPPYIAERRLAAP